MTVAAWIFSRTFPFDDATIVSKRDGGQTGYQLDTTVDTGPRTAGFKLTSSSGANMLRYGTTVMQLNQWYHVVGVYDAAALTMTVYVDGAVDNGPLVGTVTASQLNSPLEVDVGRRPGLAGFEFSGLIDEVIIYNRALTAAEVQAVYTSGVAADPVPPSVSLTAPAAGSTASHVVPISANASDNVAVTSVQFLADGASVGTDTAAPYTVSWDTTPLPNGVHVLTAVARDAAGNQTTSTPVSVTTLNPAFVNEVVVPGITAATTIVFLPGGRMLVGELTETIWVVQPGAAQPDATPFLQLDYSQMFGEQGLMDIVLDPNFAQNNYYYVFYTKGFPGQNNRDTVSRFTASGNRTVAGSEFVVWQDDANSNSEHHGGALGFGPDGKLYVSTGEHFNPPDAQRLDSFHGKILRLNSDGTVPSDNPFFDGNGPNKDAIWAYGLRNPFRMSFDSVTGRLYIADVGGNDPNTAFEEVNLGVRGANYGWPLCEGDCAVSGVTSPIFSYPHLGRDASITGGFVYRGSQFPSGYYGTYFFADYVQNTIKQLTFDANGNVSAVLNFWPSDGTPDGPVVGDPVKLVQGPDGAIYYVDIGFNDQHVPNPAAIRRVRYSIANQPPVAAASAVPLSGQPPLPVTFSSAGSVDPEGAALTYAWTFGDGGTSTLANPQHTYQAAGLYTARLSVSDGVNSSLSGDLSITVGNPPTASILAPTDGSTFRAGDVINFSGSGSDPEDGNLPASAFSWTILFHHDSHLHPGGGVAGTKTGTLTIPTSGHDFEGATNYEIVLTVTDSTGLTSSKSVTVVPQKVNLSFDSVPSGLTVTVDGISKQTPFVVGDLIGFQHTLDAPGQVSGGSAYTFSSWSDGGAQSHGIVVPAVDASYVATFSTAAPSGAVAAYGFEEGSGSSAGDSSGNGNAGILNGATWTTAGKYGRGLSFNGSTNYVDLGNPAALRITGSMTWSAWIMATAAPADDGQIVAKSGGGAEGWQFKTSPDTGPHTFGVAVSADGSSNTQRYSNTVRALGTWYYVAGVYDATARTLHVYVNGALDDGVLAGTVPGSQFDSSQNVNIGRRSGGFYFQGTLDELRIYSRALSAAEIVTDMNTPIAAQNLDTQPPSQPGNLGAVSATGTQVNLSWTASTDDVGVTGYLIERCQGAVCSSFAQIATVTATTYSDFGLAVNTSYSYRVRAKDAAAHTSLYSNVATVVTVDSQSPTTPGSLGAVPQGGSQINLSWTASTDDVGVTAYLVERCQGNGCASFAQVGTTAATTYSDQGLTTATSYSYRVRATDAANHLSQYSNVASAVTGDTQSPTAPTNLNATAQSGTQINLTWTAATDNVAVTIYRIERCQGNGCVNFAEVGTSASTSFNDTGLSAATVYLYRVRAGDAAGNLGAYSTVATATTQAGGDSQAPSVPGGLAALVVAAGQINVSWSASTDNVGVTGYRVERCQGASCSTFAQIATPSGLSFIDAGLAGSTSYSYRVRAADAASNLSGYATVSNATTQALSSLVAAYSFREGSGTSLLDISGRVHNGVIANASWTSSGKYGNALVFNGTSSLVTIADTAALHLTTGMTVEAWVNPTLVNGAWRDVVYKGDDNYYLEATTTRSGGRPGAGFRLPANIEVFGTSNLALNTWTHIAMTYNGTTLRFYVNGVQVASSNRSGSMITSTNPLQIGGDSIYGQFFQGTIDDVRVYNVALTQAQIQADMNAPVGG